MITFSEGLPRSGKSYEAVSVYIAEALRKGREVVAYVEGLGEPACQAKLAEAAQLPLRAVAELLHPITREQAREIHKHARRNALHVVDEAQNFWGNKAKLGDEFMQFVAEHGHRGEDWLLMGQDIRDVHVVWRRRVEIRRRYLKLTAVGMENRYAVTTERCVSPDQFEPVGQTLTNKYDERWFGSYKSHVDQDVNTGNFKDKRATLLSRPMLVIGVPLALLASVVAGVFVFRSIGNPGGTMLASPKPASAPIGGGGPLVPALVVKAPTAPPAASAVPISLQEDVSPPERLIRSALGDGGRLRLAGLLQRGDRITGVVEVLDKSRRAVERFTIDQLRDMGFAVAVGDGYVRLAVGKWQSFATMWPLDPPEGMVPRPINEQIAAEGHAAPGHVAIGARPVPALKEMPGELEELPQRPRVRLPRPGSPT